MGSEIEQRDREGIRISDLFGPVVFGDSEALPRTTVLRLVNDAHIKIILNLAEVTYVDDDAFGALVVCHARLRRAGGEPKLVNVGPVHLQLFVLMKVEGVFEVFENEQHAVNSFFPGRAVQRFDILAFVQK